MRFFSTSVAFLAALVATSANPIERSTQDGWSPKIIFPSEGVTLEVGIKYGFAWLVPVALSLGKIVDRNVQEHL
jgi:hypothetical protein